MTASFFCSALGYAIPLTAQRQMNFVKLTPVPQQKKVIVTINGAPFTEYLYPGTMEKPVLYPLRTASGNIITRGFPLMPRADEPVDHPHHVGLWLDYEDVNGLDFWNNSYAIPANRKSKYGWIKTDKILTVRSGKTGELKVSANWENQAGNTLLKEVTTYFFSGTSDTRTIDRITILTAQKEPVEFKDAKDGLLGLRVARELQIPSGKPEKYTDIHGNTTTVAAGNINGENGNYLTSEGKEGDAAWGTRGVWCMLYGIKDKEMVSIGIIDHPGNPGYPTYWHARGYGLFAANPLGQKIFSDGKDSLNLTVQPGQSVTFRYRVYIKSGKKATKAEMDRQAAVFAKVEE